MKYPANLSTGGDVGDLLIWDNIQTQHLAMDDYWLPQRRRMRRTTVKGVAPDTARPA